MTDGNYKTAAVIGTGMMGPGIAVTLALGGLRTTILSRTPEGALQGLEKARAEVSQLRDTGLVEAGRAARALSLLECSAALDDSVSRADLVIESGPEDMGFKQKLFAHLDSIAKPDAVLGTNTSGLSITQVAMPCSRPGRVLTTHFWNPPHLMRLVELVKGEKTSDEVVASVRQLMKRCGKVPVVVKKDRPGQLGNRLQMALWREAIHIVQEGIADVEDVDLAAKSGFGQRLPVYGIFEHADAVGLDMVLAIIDYIAKDLYNEPKAPDLMSRLVEQGTLGAKTGRGFYDWSKKSLAEVLERRNAFLIEFLKSHPVGE